MWKMISKFIDKYSLLDFIGKQWSYTIQFKCVILNKKTDVIQSYFLGRINTIHSERDDNR